MPQFDELDTAILRELQVDARRTNRDVAAAVGVAPTTALDRTRALRDRGVIRGATLDVDLDALGRTVQALVAVRVRPPSRERIEGFRTWAAGLPEVVGVFVTSGAEDFLLHLAVPDNQALYAFVIDRLTERPEVADVRTSVVYEHLRTRVTLPLPAAGRPGTVRPGRGGGRRGASPRSAG
ncbi:DNA-binding transcriptional regulator, Lrp family [Microlunatus sagamiharensis]|uniref:DNA-binding transcriptional regulator, Lrp family n=1 Tax=Microlunatus sagamiharensis TaxID=546874 RepID=A0A1H2NBT2_9ACTN|nr:Lrp/AsnC family transcriptional regulator [Microlunatus sagamiharensis]SDV02834.1 DNA-binding transcriptional regulator, Lrp family [Microlunatus sagamiharensis]